MKLFTIDVEAVAQSVDLSGLSDEDRRLVSKLAIPGSEEVLSNKTGEPSPEAVRQFVRAFFTGSVEAGP